jgi:drug/metabolite transporter (DMT)-like permease
MAQTKKKRRSKHRGNAAGVVEARGRTGRKPTEEERKKTAAADARRERMNREPTWKAATIRAALAALVFGALLVLLFDTPPGQAVSLTCFVFLFYIPLGYYTDIFIYKRRRRGEARS